MKLRGATFDRLWRYGLTAGAAAVVDLGGFAILDLLNVPVLLAAILSYLAANVVNYVLSATYAFGDRASLRRYPGFLAASSIGLLVNVTITAVLAGAGLPAVAAKFVAIGVAFFVNFLLNALVVFPAKAGE